MKTLTEAVKACGGVWPSEAPIMETGIVRGWYGDVDQDPEFIVIDGGRKRIHRPEFEAESARLSGKPGWGEAPEWAQSLAQFPDGQWIWLSTPSPMERDHGWADMSGETSTIQHAGQGVILSDWRDTLERRPEVEVASSERAEWDGTGYPPPDTKCEFKAVTRDGVFSHNNFADDYEPCTIKYASESGCHLIDRDGAECFMDSLDYMITFRFLKSDRERWVEMAADVVRGTDVMLTGAMQQEICQAIYDALKSGELPIPE